MYDVVFTASALPDGRLHSFAALFCTFQLSLFQKIRFDMREAEAVYNRWSSQSGSKRTAALPRSHPSCNPPQRDVQHHACRNQFLLAPPAACPPVAASPCPQRLCRSSHAARALPPSLASALPPPQALQHDPLNHPGQAGALHVVVACSNGGRSAGDGPAPSFRAGSGAAAHIQGPPQQVHGWRGAPSLHPPGIS